MKSESEDALMRFIVSNGCFSKKVNKEIYNHYFKGSYKVIERLWKFIDFRNKRTLDIGCGYGQHLIHFSRDSLGIDNDSRKINFAESLGLNVKMADVEDGIPLPASSFNTVYCNNLLEHITSPFKLLIEIYRILKPSGVVVVGVPNMDVNWLTRKLTGYTGWAAEGHINAFNQKSLEFLVRKAGYQIVDAFSSSIAFPFLVNKILARNLLLRYGTHLFIVGKKLAIKRVQ
jgi:SAM-dependent methyltransferase